MGQQGSNIVNKPYSRQDSNRRILQPDEDWPLATQYVNAIQYSASVGYEGSLELLTAKNNAEDTTEYNWSHYWGQNIQRFTSLLPDCKQRQATEA